jgi:hypothetical protein
MKSNVGGIDRILRIVIGLVLIALAAHRHRGCLGLDRRRAAGHGGAGLLPAVHRAGHQQLPGPARLSAPRAGLHQPEVLLGSLYPFACGWRRQPARR